MKLFKHIVFITLLFNATGIVSQNKRVPTPPPIENPPPQAHFSWINDCSGDTICFYNQSILCPTYTWTVFIDTIGLFGFPHPKVLKKTVNDSVNCFHFNGVGTFSITLTCYDNHLDSLTQSIHIDSLMTLSFYYFNCRDVFINQSTCISSFYWDFGDGLTSNAVSPIHKYADTGYYHVTLIGYNGIKSDTLKRQIHIPSVGFVNPAFTYTVSHDTAFVHGIDSSPNNSFNWTWADGTYSTGEDTFHVYKDSTAAYNVTLFAINSVCGAASSSDSIKISHSIKTPAPKPPPDLDFSNSILTIVPNPVSTSGYIDAFFNAYTPDNYLTQVYNAIGQKMFEEYFSFDSGINEFKISTVNFSSGVYIMVMQAGNSYIRRKFYVINTP